MTVDIEAIEIAVVEVTMSMSRVVISIMIVDIKVGGTLGGTRREENSLVMTMGSVIGMRGGLYIQRRMMMRKIFEGLLEMATAATTPMMTMRMTTKRMTILISGIV